MGDIWKNFITHHGIIGQEWGVQNLPIHFLIRNIVPLSRKGGAIPLKKN